MILSNYIHKIYVDENKKRINRSEISTLVPKMIYPKNKQIKTIGEKNLPKKEIKMNKKGLKKIIDDKNKKEMDGGDTEESKKEVISNVDINITKVDSTELDQQEGGEEKQKEEEEVKEEVQGIGEEVVKALEEEQGGGEEIYDIASGLTIPEVENSYGGSDSTNTKIIKIKQESHEGGSTHENNNQIKNVVVTSFF